MGARRKMHFKKQKQFFYNILHIHRLATAVNILTIV